MVAYTAAFHFSWQIWQCVDSMHIAIFTCRTLQPMISNRIHGRVQNGRVRISAEGRTVVLHSSNCWYAIRQPSCMDKQDQYELDRCSRLRTSLSFCFPTLLIVESPSFEVCFTFTIFPNFGFALLLKIAAPCKWLWTRSEQHYARLKTFHRIWCPWQSEQSQRL